MAIRLNRIEKEFVLAKAKDQGAEVLVSADKAEWPLRILETGSENILFSHAMSPGTLRKFAVYEFRFAYGKQPIAFRAKVEEIGQDRLRIAMPDAMHKNIERRYSRRSPPRTISASFAFGDDRYTLSLPKTKSYARIVEPEASSTFNPRNMKLLVADFNARAVRVANEWTLRMFKDHKPESLEERFVASTGKIYYLPSGSAGLPLVNPSKELPIATRGDFIDFLKIAGQSEDAAEEEVLRFERNKKNLSLVSEFMIPVLFQEYAVGRIHLVKNKAGLRSLDLATLSVFLQFTKVLAYSLMINGYFRDAPQKSEEYKAEILDISAGGLLFGNASPELSLSLLKDSGLELNIRVDDRIMKAKARVKRRYRDAKLVYYGCEFEELAPEDFRFLFETLYGRAFTDDDATSIEGIAVLGPGE